MKSDQFSDEKLRETILNRLAGNDQTAFANVRVGVLNGVAHLAGVVTSLDAYIAAAEITQSVLGVRGVVNRIEAPGAPRPSRTIHLELTAANAERKNNDKVPE
jgi:osmotically-inducible protein OsmY